MRTLTKKYTTIIILILLLAISLAFFTSPDEIVQPINYNHKIHIEEDLDCIDCHKYYEEQTFASLPSLEVCEECHGDEAISESPEELKLLKYIEEGREIPWQQIYNVPDHVYFSHRRHVLLGEIECKTCHGDVANLTEPPAFPVVSLMMDDCLDCHKENKITNDCLTCHR